VLREGYYEEGRKRTLLDFGFKNVSIFADVVGAAAGERGRCNSLALLLQFADKLGCHVIGIAAMTLIIAVSIRDELIGIKLFEVVMRACALIDGCQIAHFGLPWFTWVTFRP
jgi:hypothetical protein